MPTYFKQAVGFDIKKVRSHARVKFGIYILCACPRAACFYELLSALYNMQLLHK